MSSSHPRHLYRAIVTLANAYGFSTSRTRRGHIRCKHRETGLTVFVSGSDGARAAANTRAALRRFARMEGTPA
jgi:hypothetical protein